MERIEHGRLGAARLWRNPSMRRLGLILAASWVVAALFVWLFTVESTHRLKLQTLAQQTAMIGRLTAENPALAEQWTRLLAHPERLSQKDAEEGRKLAGRYGLTTTMETAMSPAMLAFSRRMMFTLGGGFFVLLALLGAAVIRENRRQSADIRKLAVALEDTVKHNLPMGYRLYEEGELGLLASSVQELAVRLQETIGQLHRDKAFLKDTVADISHQLKTPLSSLIIYVDLLREGNVDETAAAEFLETCRRQLERMEWLTLTLLKIARLEASALDLQKVPACVAQTVERAVTAVRRLAEDRGVEVAVTAPDASSDIPVPHDSRWLAEAVVNLLKNAVEHSPQGSVVTIGWETTSVFLRLYVQDMGPGIDDKHLPHIFKKFYRASGQGSGVGLGLPLAKTIVERHGGMLSVGPGSQGGCRFLLTIPLHPLPMTEVIKSYNSVSEGTVDL